MLVLTDGSWDKPGILIIPHQPHRTVKVRAVEQARFLARQNRYRVYLLHWDVSVPASSSVSSSVSLFSVPLFSSVRKIFRKVTECFKTLTTPARMDVELADGSVAECLEDYGSEDKTKPLEGESLFYRVTLPHLLAPTPLCQWFNQRQLERFVQKHRIQAVLSGNAYHFPMPDNPGLYRLYDVVDDHLTPGSGPCWRQTRAFTLRELRKADACMSISYALQTVLQQEGVVNSLRIPNGVDLKAFQAVTSEALQQLRDRYQLHHRFVIGYIGNHGWWGGLDLLFQAFQELQKLQDLQKNLSQAVLFIVGPGEDLPRYQAQFADNPNVIFTGPVPPADIAAYFHVSDIGVLPFDLCPFTHNALPLKILEYGAARKRVLATPLQELATLQFPHVTLLEANPTLWASALLSALASTSCNRHLKRGSPNDLYDALDDVASSDDGADGGWCEDWDRVIAAYDWSHVLKPLETTLAAALEISLETPHAPAV